MVSKLDQNSLLPYLAIVSLVVCGSGVKSTDLSLFGIQCADAQVPTTTSETVSPSEVWRQVYKQMPNLPLENHYVNKETGKVDSDNTLVSRLIRYHIYVKGRPPIYRLDWKLTLADYLGANETMVDSQYPGSDTLRQNPIEGDRAAINRLNRSQRDALVQVLVNIFNPKNQATSTVDSSAVPQSQATRRAIPTQPQPGAAHLLLP